MVAVCPRPRVARRSAVALLCALLVFLNTPGAAAAASEAAFTAVFGSCSRPQLDHSFWPGLYAAATGGATPADPVTQESPPLDAMVWLGDVVYHDRITVPIWAHFTQHGPDAMRAEWETFRRLPQYNAFIARTAAVVGIYDDHDMGANDEGKESWSKAFNQQRLLDFLGVAEVDGDGRAAPAAARARRRRDGVYAFHRLPMRASGVATAHVCFLMIDARTHRDPPRHDGAGDMLGEVQWAWLEAVLRTGRDPEYEEQAATDVTSIDDVCVVTFIGTGVQIAADAQPMENWGEFPEARDRLMKVLAASGARRFAFLTGDVHFAEFNRLSPVPEIAVASDGTREVTTCAEGPLDDQDVFEATSSGLTQLLHPLFADEERFMSWFPSHRRVGRPFTSRNAGVLKVVCEDPTRRPDDCVITINLLAIPNATTVRTLEWSFAQNRREVAAAKDRLRKLAVENPRVAAGLRQCADRPAHTVPTTYALWTRAIMATKTIPGLHEVTRLYMIFIHAWALVLAMVAASIYAIRALVRVVRGDRVKAKTQ